MLFPWTARAAFVCQWTVSSTRKTAAHDVEATNAAEDVFNGHSIQQARFWFWLQVCIECIKMAWVPYSVRGADSILTLPPRELLSILSLWSCFVLAALRISGFIIFLNSICIGIETQRSIPDSGLLPDWPTEAQIVWKCRCKCLRRHLESFNFNECHPAPFRRKGSKKAH